MRITFLGHKRPPMPTFAHGLRMVEARKIYIPCSSYKN